jgi:hypothetical protein|tara:strand:- start:39 stop:332 length:294 start_codon:yes stop_codon:yes gene_type:complete
VIYLKWKLAEGTWGTGPEAIINDRGSTAMASWAVDDDGYRIGYLTDSVDLSGLETWDVTEVTESEALAFCQNIWADATVDSNGYITSQSPPETEEVE